ncbi:MAG: 16S rRNA (cytosine967-C5)-methyltransferase [Bacteroidia bacterium]|jgi:16S rRNA (cytosine967-C5)-methyltransferase
MKSQHIFNRHTDFAITCLETYEIGKPFHPILHRYFKENKQFGSRDRKTIKNLSYNWFRLGYSFAGISKRDQVILSYMTLTEDVPEWMLLCFEPFLLPPSWLDWNLSERLDFLQKAIKWSIDDIFPSLNKLTENIDKSLFLHHQFNQPLVWVRVKNNGERAEVLRKLPEAVAKENGAIGVVAGHYIEASGVGKQVEVQDYSSQQVYGSLDLDGVQSIWDCCCASGGKSLTLLDRTKSINIFGSDNRKSILANFLKRTGRHRYRVWSAVVDLTNVVSKIQFSSKQSQVEITPPSFDVILADVPCSGSGTWNRNPEFKLKNKASLDYYTSLQRDIVTNSWMYLKKGGSMLYTTCSVYSVENEDMIDSLKKLEFEIIRSGYIHGYDNKSDTMFYAELKKI